MSSEAVWPNRRHRGSVKKGSKYKTNHKADLCFCYCKTYTKNKNKITKNIRVWHVRLMHNKWHVIWSYLCRAMEPTIMGLRLHKIHMMVVKFGPFSQTKLDSASLVLGHAKFLNWTIHLFSFATITSTFSKWHLIAILSLPRMRAYYSLTRKKMTLQRVQIYLDGFSPQNLECLCSHWQKSKKLFSENVFKFICLFYL